MLPIISLKERKVAIYTYNIKGVRIYKEKKMYYFLLFNNYEEEKKENRKKRTILVDESNKILQIGWFKNYRRKIKRRVAKEMIKTQRRVIKWI